MKNLLAIAIVATCGLIVRAQSTQPAAWTEYSSSAGRFTVLMPSKPEEKTMEAPSDLVSGTMKMTTAVAITDTTVYAANFCDYPAEISKLPAKQVLDSAQKSAVSNMRGRLLGDEEITLKGHPGRAIRIESNDSQMLFRARIYLVGNRAYQIIAIGPKHVVVSRDAERFFDSFKLVGN
jgi:hypothetical protein